MTKQIFLAVAAVVFGLLPMPARSEDVSQPHTLLGYLQPGMHVGIQSVEGTSSVVLDVYTDEQFAIARDLVARSRTIDDAAEFAAKHPGVRDKLDAFLAKLAQDAPDANTDQVKVFPLPRTTLGTISAVGGDYVLIERDGSVRRRLVIPNTALSRIDLDAEPVRFFHRSLR